MAAFRKIQVAPNNKEICVKPPGAARKDRSKASPSFKAASKTAGETRMFSFFALVEIGR
jgi:hypothetical protein